jgi:hypothetical protein
MDPQYGQGPRPLDFCTYLLRGIQRGLMSSKSSRILHQSKDYYSTVASQQDEILVKNVWVKFRVFPLTNNLKTTEKSCVISY